MSVLIAADFSADEWAAWWPALQAALPGEFLVRESTPRPTITSSAPREGSSKVAEPHLLENADLSDVEIALVANPPPGLLATLPRLRLIQSLWAGVDRLLADPSLPTQIALARMVDPALSEAIAQTALWAVLSLHRGFFDYGAQQRRREWQQLPQRRADEVNVAVLGLGETGRAAALRLAQIGYRVTGWSTRPAALSGIEVRAGADALAAVLGGSEIIVNLLPLTLATRGLFNQSSFARMRRGASLVNLGRGGHVVEPDLLNALDCRQLRHAVLDVFEVEPLVPEHRLWMHPQVTVLPHIAAATDPRSAAQVVARNVYALRNGTPLAHLVDRQRGY
jgi:glyoxylate/hydroxypyruvate reductase